MRENNNSWEDLSILVDKVNHFVDDLTVTNLMNIEFVSWVNSILRQISEIKLDQQTNSDMEFASALFKASTQTRSLNKDLFFQDQLETEVVQNASVLREMLRQASLKIVLDSNISNELRLRLESKAYILKGSLQDLWERYQKNYQSEPRSPLQNELK